MKNDVSIIFIILMLILNMLSRDIQNAVTLISSAKLRHVKECVSIRIENTKISP